MAASSSVVFYHRTSSGNAKRILAEGFKDGRGSYMIEDKEFEGVWLSDRPIDCNEGAFGDTLFKITLVCSPDEMDFWEWCEEGRGFREWLVPAAQLNSRAQVERIDDCE